MNKKLFWLNLFLLYFFFVLTRKYGFATLRDYSEVKGKMWIFIIFICFLYIYKVFKPKWNAVCLVFNIISVILYIIILGFYIKGAEEFVIIKGYISIVKYASHDEKVDFLCQLMLEESKARPNFIDKFVKLDDLKLLEFKEIIPKSRTLHEVEVNFNKFVYWNFGPRPNLLLYEFIFGLMGVFLGTMWFILIYFLF